MSRSRSPVVLVVVAMLFLSVGVAGLAFWSLNPHGPRDFGKAPGIANGSQAPSVSTAPAMATKAANRDGALWARPVQGRPIELPGLPAGTQAIFHVRFRELLAHPEGDKVLRSLGPHINQALRHTTQQVDVPANRLQTLTVVFLPAAMPPQLLVLGQLVSDGVPRESLRLPPGVPGVAGGQSETRGDDMITAWLPTDGSEMFAFGPNKLVQELVDRAQDQQDRAATAPMQRQLRELLSRTHDSDQITLLANPTFFRDEAKQFIPGPPGVLWNALEQFWTDRVQAALLSIQLGDMAFFELRLVAQEDSLPQTMARDLKARLQGLAGAVSSYLGQIQLVPYWQSLALRFPTMVQFLVEQSRVGVEDRQVVVTTVGPAEALHNIFLATELTLASSQLTGAPRTGGPGIGGASIGESGVTNGNLVESKGAMGTSSGADGNAAETDRSGWGLDELLSQKFNVAMNPLALDELLQELVEEVESQSPGRSFQLVFEVLGNDLRRDGVTRNRLIRDLRAKQESLAEILTRLVMKANPITAAEPSDPAQKLVWVAVSEPTPKIIITTRRGAELQQLPIPAIFAAK